MRNLEALARQTVQKVTGNRFAGCIANGMNKTVKLGPSGRQVGKELFNLFVAAHIAIENQIGIKIGSKFGDAVFETFAHITEGQLGSLGMTGFGDTVCDRAARQHAGDQQPFSR